MIPLRRANALVHSRLVRRALVLIPLLCIAAGACGSSAKSAIPTTTTASIPTTTTSPPTTTGGETPGPSTTIATTIKESAYIVSVDTTAHTLTVDPMEFLTGSPANAAYRHDYPGTLDTPPNDYYIVNPTKDRVVLPLTPDVVILLYRTATALLTDPKRITPTELAHLGELNMRPFWITIERGEVSEIEEQYVP
jgi:hypothetical protein